MLQAVRNGATGIDATAPGQPPGASTFAVENWNAMFDAVESRLRSTVGERSAEATDPTVSGASDRVRTSVLECAAALEQLHAALTLERAGRRELEAEVLVARTSLAHALAELAGTQAEERRARHRASHDGLTSLPTGAFFLERIDRLLARAEPQPVALAVLYLDLDGFRTINDVHGHDVGDEVLRIVAARLGRAIRSEDTVGRLGGDEFACLLANLPSLEQLSHLACKIFDAVSTPLKIGDLALSVRASIGIATFPADGVTAAALLRSADAAMDRARRSGTGYAFFENDPLRSFADSGGHALENRPNPRRPIGSGEAALLRPPVERGLS